MAAHRHKEPSGSALVDAARAALAQTGERWTDMRGAIFATLAGSDRPVSAYDIAERMSAARGKTVAANSVYRILDLFVRANLADRIESANAYIANPHPGCRHDCVFVICDGCGIAEHFDDDRLAASLRAGGEALGFSSLRPVIELRGRCAACG